MACASQRDELDVPQTPGISVAQLDHVVYPRPGAPDTVLNLPRQPQWRSNDGVVVSDDRSALLLIDSAGVLQRRIGRRGSGPGEFKMLWSFTVLAGDSLLAYDPQLRRMTQFSPKGEVANSHAAQLNGHGSPAWSTDGSTFSIDGAFMNRAFLGTVQRRGDVLDTGWILYAARGDTLSHQVWQALGEHKFAGEGVAFDILFAGEPFIAAMGDWVVSGHGEFDDLEIRDRRGVIIARFRSGLPRTRVTPRLVREYFDSAAAAGDRVTQADVDRAIVSDSTPRFDRILADKRHCIWLRQWSSPQSSTVDWVVVDATGRRQATVRFPRLFKPTDLAEGRALGLLYDEDDVMRVAVYRFAPTPKCVRPSA